ncbi:MAG: hypothetical protein IT322_04020 [Anaerolineae bacterium]|nr:hypothetical protein [Anaerolineae bacterium]
MGIFPKYEKMRENGQSSEEVYIASIFDKNKTDTCLRILRVVFNLSLDQAIEIANRGEQEAFSRYRNLQAAGASPNSVLTAVKSDGLDPSFQLKVLMFTFGLSVNEAKKLLVDNSNADR